MFITLSCLNQVDAILPGEFNINGCATPDNICPIYAYKILFFIKHFKPDPKTVRIDDSTIFD